MGYLDEDNTLTEIASQFIENYGKNEHAILLDIPSGGKNGKYHSAVLTTYAIDLIHFDNQLLNMLHRKQVCSINVFADTNQMDKSMEYVSPIYMRHIGKEYSITSISAVGAFHPKINFFVGDDAVLVVFGTGNLTVTGHGKIMRHLQVL